MAPDASGPPRVFVALDRGDAAEDLALATRLDRAQPGTGWGFKINLDSALDLTPGGPGLYDSLARFAALDRPLFLDLKMWNGGRTMARIADSLAARPELRVEVVDVYPHAGVEFVRKVADALEGSSTRLFGLSVLTHYSDDDAQALYGRPLERAVRFLAGRARAAGCRGLVCPVRFAPQVRELGLDPLCPGIRPEWFEDQGANHQVQVATPTEAVEAGAWGLVIGSPVTRSEEPGEALGRVLREVGFPEG